MSYSTVVCHCYLNTAKQIYEEELILFNDDEGFEILVVAAVLSRAQHRILYNIMKTFTCLGIQRLNF